MLTGLPFNFFTSREVAQHHDPAYEVLCDLVFAFASRLRPALTVPAAVGLKYEIQTAMGLPTSIASQG
jgi:hypothetical protein